MHNRCHQEYTVVIIGRTENSSGAQLGELAEAEDQKWG